MALVDPRIKLSEDKKVSKWKLLINLSLNLLVVIAVLLRLSIHRPILIGNRLLASFFQKINLCDARHFVSDFIDELYLSHGCAL